jgi:hypothetical protein
MQISVKAEIRTMKSKEGKEYKALILKLTDKTEKMVIVSPAEIELLELKYGIK